MERKKWLGIVLAVSSAVVIRFFININYAFIPTVGKSMAPAIMHGDIILIKKGAENICIGDIICFRINLTDRISVSHRVIDIIEEGSILTFQTKGDANENIDKWKITNDQIIGKILWVIPTHIFLEPYMSVVTMLILVSVMSIGVIYNNYQEKK